MTIDERQNVAKFNRKLDRILQGLPPGKGKLTLEDRYTLALAKRAAQIDLSKQSKIQEKLRLQLESLAMIQLPHASSLSPYLLFRPRRLSWVGLVMLVQLVLGSVFGSMSTLSNSAPSIQSIACVTPPAELSLTRSPETYPSRWISKNSPGSEIQLGVDHPQPVPTPLAPLINTVLPKEFVTSIKTPLQVENPVEP